MLNGVDEGAEVAVDAEAVLDGADAVEHGGVAAAQTLPDGRLAQGQVLGGQYIITWRASAISRTLLLE